MGYHEHDDAGTPNSQRTAVIASCAITRIAYTKLDEGHLVPSSRTMTRLGSCEVRPSGSECKSDADMGGAMIWSCSRGPLAGNPKYECSEVPKIDTRTNEALFSARWQDFHGAVHAPACG
jgi:hypothetical protein